MIKISKRLQTELRPYADNMTEAITGVFVRAADPETGRYDAFDVALLDDESLDEFLDGKDAIYLKSLIRGLLRGIGRGVGERRR